MLKLDVLKPSFYITFDADVISVFSDPLSKKFALLGTVHARLQEKISKIAEDALIESGQCHEVLNPRYASKLFQIIAEELTGTQIFFAERSVTKCFDQLTEQRFLTLSQKKQIDGLLSHQMLEGGRMKDTYYRRDPDEAVGIAEGYLLQKKLDAAIRWLYCASRYLESAQDGRTLGDVVKLSKYFRPELRLSNEAIQTAMTHPQMRIELAKRTDTLELDLRMLLYRSCCEFLKLSPPVERVRFFVEDDDDGPLEEIDCFADALAVNTFLKRADLTDFGIGDVEVEEIVAALQVNKYSQLQCLDFRYSNITDIGAEKLLDLMKSCPNLTVRLGTTKAHRFMRRDLFMRIYTLNLVRPFGYLCTCKNLESLGYRFIPASIEECKLLVDFAIASNDIYNTRTESREVAHQVFDIPPTTFQNGIVEKLTVSNTMVGFFAIYCREDGVYELSHLFVKAGRQNCGYGTLLFERMIERMVAAGGTRMEWLCDPDAKEFYIKLGAKIIGTEQNLLNPKVDLPIFAYDLVP